MVEKSFFDFIHDYDGIIDVRNLGDLPKVISRLETFSLFETAKRVKDWNERLSSAIEEEFDDECLEEPIQFLAPYEYEEHTLDGGWVHEWELPPAFLPPLEGGDSGTFYYGTGENL